MEIRKIAANILMGGIGALMWLAAGGCGWLDNPGRTIALYGPPVYPHDPTVHFVDFSYTPASPIKLGDTLVFEAKINKPYDELSMMVSLGNRAGAILNDVGDAPDDVANDGAYHGTFDWTPDLGLAKNVPIVLHLSWGDGTGYEDHDGPPLDVTE